MAKFITENNIEKAILQKLVDKKFDYDVIFCSPNPKDKEILDDGTGRKSKTECILPNVLRKSLIKINPNIPESIIDEKIRMLTQDFSGSDLIQVNYEMYNKIRNFILVTTKKNGTQDFDFMKLIDFDTPKNNTFTVVSQMWIKGRYNWKRPDLLIFVNGLPLIFIELKNSIIKIEEAYNKNLQEYIKDIPNLFVFNQICVLSNGLETKIGAFSADYDFFFEWLKVDSEKEIIDRDQIKQKGISIEYLLDGLFKKDKLLDYIENFIMFNSKRYKIIARNHQFLGVNNLIASIKNRETLHGKLGVFWHTQGSGKSYSMIFLARKVRKKIPGNFTFLIVTDREELNTQICKNFIRTELIGPKDECQPKSGKQLREYLKANKDFIFTLIQKFRYDDIKKYPLLSERNDIIVMVDEAHRTLYNDLAQNMRTALPNANYIAFTGTPILGKKKLTSRWFGDYVSEYTFLQSIEEGATVPIFYSRRLPEVGLKNNFLDDDIVEIIENENLNEDEEKRLKNSKSNILEIIKRDDRLNKIAKDIAHHFPRRGFLGKGMVVCVDKFTAVKMYDKVKKYWEEEKRNLTAERNSEKDISKRKNISKILEYMNSVEMAVIVSEEKDEAKKFAKHGLDITNHRKKMNEITKEGLDIESRFKNPNDNLQLVFVCSMWLTGFDVPSLSTLYLDKPMKSHTLMQAIARTNRIYINKTCGFIVDYINVFNFMKQALSDYAAPNNKNAYPAQNVDDLILLLEESIYETDKFLTSKNIDLNAIISKTSTFEKLEALREAYDIIVDNEESKEKFKVLSNISVNLYEASKPEILEKNWENTKFLALEYLSGLINNKIDDEKIEKAKFKISQILDSSIIATPITKKDFTIIPEEKIIDLSKIDIEKLQSEIKTAKYKAVEIDNLKEYIDNTLRKMINKNNTRISFSERFKKIIDQYNSGNRSNVDYYKELFDFVENLKNEQQRAAEQGLTEEELEIYDILLQNLELTKTEKKQVKMASKILYTDINKNKDKLLVIDWYKDEKTKLKLKNFISASLDKTLPSCYNKDIFSFKVTLLLERFIDMAAHNCGWIAENLF